MIRQCCQYWLDLWSGCVGPGPLGLWLFALVMVAGQAMAAPVVKDVRLGHQGQVTRFVLETDGAIDFQVFSLIDPYRIVIDVSEVNFGSRDHGKGLGAVENYRFGLFKPGTSRVVLDLKSPALVKQAFVIPPRQGYGHRLVVDLAATNRAAFMAALRLPEEAAQIVSRAPSVGAQSPAALRAERKRKLIVLDPGHGGVDPGASSVKGRMEKSITLAIARVIRDELEKSGVYTVQLTRDQDIFIPLRQRFEIARAAGADMFISLHADSFRTADVRGASIYTLSETASDREAELLAAKENKADIIAGINLAGEEPEVSNILIDLARRETMTFSTHFAGILVSELGKVTTMRKNSHRYAGFLVLKAPDVPSVLFEMGYLSNPADAAALEDRRHQQRIAHALRQALDTYFLKLASHQVSSM